MSRFFRAGAAGLAAAMVLVVAPSTQAAPAGDSANWLSRQLTDGLVHNNQYDFDDIGLTIDTGIALRTVGGHGTDVRRIRGAVGRHLGEYVAPGADVYAGAAAKALVWAQMSGAGPRSYGGLNLVTMLNRRVAADGRITDKSQWGDYANVVGQAYAVRGLAIARSTKRGKALGFLLKQQCTAGYFRVSFTADKNAPDQTCEGGDKATVSAPDTDATALAVLQLQALPTKTAQVRRAIRTGVTWLARRQKANGSLGGGALTAGSNANSTGLAAWAFGSTGRCAKARSAARWVTRLQANGDLSGTRLRRHRGAIAYNAPAMRVGEEQGITRKTQDQWRRTTTQAAPGLRYVRGCR